MTELEFRELISEYCNSKNLDYINYIQNNIYESDTGFKEWLNRKNENKNHFANRILNLKVWSSATRIIELGKTSQSSLLGDLRNKLKIISVSNNFDKNILDNKMQYNGNLITKKGHGYLALDDRDYLLTQSEHLLTVVDDSISIYEQIDLARKMINLFTESNIKCTIGTYGNRTDYDINYKMQELRKLTDYYNNVSFNSNYMSEGKTLGYSITTKKKK